MKKLVHTVSALLISLALLLSDAQIVHAATCPTPGQDPCWVGQAPLPTTRHGLGVAADPSGRIYAAAGGGDGDLYVLEMYDPLSDTWTTKTPPPVARVYSGFTFSPLTNKFYLVGGWNGGIFDDVHEYDPVADTWTAKASMPVLREVFAAATGPNGKIYIIGGSGSDGICSNLVEEYDPSTDTWVTKTPMPTARCGLTATAAPNGKIYAIGGELGALAGNAPTAIVEAYDPATDTWTTKAPMTHPRWNLAASVTAAGNILAAGGEDITGTFHDTDVVEEYTLATDTWATKTPLPTPTNQFGMALGSDGRVHALGGQINTGAITNAHYAGFTPDPTEITALAPAQVWIGLKNSDDVGVKFDLLAEAFKNNTLIATGQLSSVPAGSSGFNNAKFNTIPFSSFAPLAFPAGTQLKIKISVRNACSGSGHNSGVARLWFNDAAANSQFGATIDSAQTYYLRDSFQLAPNPGPGPKSTLDIQAGAKCSSFKSFGTWIATL